jgi:hypothetical protein
MVQVVHGLSIPMGKLGFFIPRTISMALSRESEEPEPFHIDRNADDTATDAEQRIRRRPGWSGSGGDTLPQRVVRIGRSIIPSGHTSATTSRATSRAPIPLSAVATEAREEQAAGGRKPVVGDAPPKPEVQRTIRFTDEQRPAAR